MLTFLFSCPLPHPLQGCEELCTLDLMVENLGRANFGSPHNFEQKKGFWEGDLLLDGRVLEVGRGRSSRYCVQDFEHIALELLPDWLEGLEGWMEYNRFLSLASLVAYCLTSPEFLLTP